MPDPRAAESILVLLALSLPALAVFEPKPWLPVEALPAEMRLIRERWLELNALSAIVGDPPAVRRTAEQMAERARELMAGQVSDPADPAFGSQGNIADLRNELISFNGGYFAEPHALAAAFASNVSPLRGDPAVLRALNAALTFGRRFFYIDAPRPNNWWAWDIGIPMRLQPALLLAGEAIDPALRDALIQTLYWQGNQPVGLGYDKPGTGANAIWIADNALRQALLCGDEALLRRASEIFADVCRLGGEKGDGIMPDGSFHQHGNGINMGYGHAMLVDCATYLWLTHGTAYALPDESVEALRRFFAEYAVWDTYRGTTNPYSSGRAGTRPGNFETAAVARAAALLLARGVPGCVEPARSLLRDRYGDATDALLALEPALHQALDAELPAIAAAPRPTGVRAWPYSDMLLSRGESHFYAVRMACDTKGWFSIHNENLRAHQTGEGSVVMMIDGREYDQAGTINQPWDSLMGVTRLPGLTRGREAMGQSLAVGCGALESIGLFAADYRIENEADRLGGKKAYILFDHALVLLGADLVTSQRSGITTTILSHRLAAPAGTAPAPLPEGGVYAHEGYHLRLLQGDAKVAARRLECDYTEVNARYPGRPRFDDWQQEITVLTLPMRPHRYAAVVGLGAEPPAVELVANGGEAQAVLTADGRRGAVAVYGEAYHGSAGGLSARGVLVWQRDGERVALLVNRRNSPAETLRITLPFAITTAPEGARVENGALLVDLPAGYVVTWQGTCTVGA